MSECQRCQIEDCHVCQQLGAGTVQCRDSFRDCTICSKTYCTIHLVMLNHEAQETGLTSPKCYCHACASLHFPSAMCRRHTKKNYETQEQCQGCTHKAVCPLCMGHPTIVCTTGKQYPTTKCHNCEKPFCDTHLNVNTESEAMLLKFMRERKPLVHRCHACSARYDHRPYRCASCLVTSESLLLMCSGCKSAHYCNKECQKKDWSNGHKQQCKLTL